MAWNGAHPEPVDLSKFEREILPGLQTLSARKLAAITGLSVSYCTAIKRGERVPHPRWWKVLS